MMAANAAEASATCTSRCASRCWTPNREPFFYTYEIYLMQGDASGERLTPEPLRAALWVDTAPPSGMRVYAVRAFTASGVSSSLIRSAPVEV